MNNLRSLWLRWKMLKLPWRKTFFVGQDLQGNTYWEFRDTLRPGRLRRMVKYQNRRTHYADVVVSPQWHQWLRQTRADAPSLHEQQQDLVRIAQLKHNAALADARWESKQRYFETPKQTLPEGAPASDIQRNDLEKAQEAGRRARQSVRDRGQQSKTDTGTNPGQNWQPESWVPGRVKR